MTSTEEKIASEDGRRARRIRNRNAVVDALFELLTTGSGVPTIEAIAEHAGVSMSSVFRYFDGVDDLQHQMMESYFTRYASLFEIPDLGQGGLEDRIAGFVTTRMHLFKTIAPIGRLARARVYDHPQLEESLVRARALFAQQVRDHFARELDRLSKQDADDAAEVIDVVCSFEGWELQSHSHGRTDEQVRRTWTSCIVRSLHV